MYGMGIWGMGIWVYMPTPTYHIGMVYVVHGAYGVHGSSGVCSI